MRLLFRKQKRMNGIVGLLPAIALLLATGLTLEWDEAGGLAHNKEFSNSSLLKSLNQ